EVVGLERNLKLGGGTPGGPQTHDPVTRNHPGIGCVVVGPAYGIPGCTGGENAELPVDIPADCPAGTVLQVVAAGAVLWLQQTGADLAVPAQNLGLQRKLQAGQAGLLNV